MVGVQSLEGRVDRGVFNRLGRVISDVIDYLAHDYLLTRLRWSGAFRPNLAKYGTAGTLGLAGVGCGVASNAGKDYNEPDTEQSTPYDASVPLADTKPVSSGTPDTGYKPEDSSPVVPPKDTYDGKDVPTSKDEGQPYDAGKDDTNDGVTDVLVSKDEGSDLEQKVCLDKDLDGRAPTGTPPDLRLGCAYKEQDDCDDKDPNVNPGMVEVKGNNKDDDCNPATKDTYTLFVNVQHGLGTGPVKGIALLVKNTEGKQAECTSTDDNGDASCELPSTEGFNLETGITSKFYQTLRSPDEVQSAVEGDVVMTLWLIEKHPLPIGSLYKDFWDFMTDTTETKPKVPIYGDDDEIIDVIDNPKTFPNYAAGPLKVFVPQNYKVNGVNYTPVMESAVQAWIDKLTVINSKLSGLLQIVKNESDANVVIIPYGGNSWTNTDDDGEQVFGATIYFNEGTTVFGKEGVKSTLIHEEGHVFGENHTFCSPVQYENATCESTEGGGGNSKLDLPSRVAAYANTIKGQQETKHIKYDFPAVK
ncbi:putative metal-binding motif-containing protein [Candidatus Woesearchaeota archaeon]|nr:putative metal-binding motif-containing protein [Candidatus Woesearchaeota archaeon]